MMTPLLSPTAALMKIIRDQAAIRRKPS